MAKNKTKAEQPAVDIDVNAFEEKPVKETHQTGESATETQGHTQSASSAKEETVTGKDNAKNSDTPRENDAPEESDGMSVIEKLKEENAQLKDQLLRSRAETENVRRRGEREKADATSYAVTGFARDMLSVTDNLRRALDAMPETISEDMKAFVEGVELTERELLKAFEHHGIKKIHPEPGEKFDHNLHQAMFEMESDQHPQGHIAQAVAPGYVIKDRLLRPAMVGTVKKK